MKKILVLLISLITISYISEALLMLGEFFIIENRKKILQTNIKKKLVKINLTRETYTKVI